jgi:hypothetical protein
MLHFVQGPKKLKQRMTPTDCDEACKDSILERAVRIGGGAVRSAHHAVLMHFPVGHPLDGLAPTHPRHWGTQ